MPTRRAPRQLSLARTSGWGGKRKGAGRKPAGERALVTHVRRPALAARFPVHVTLRVLPHVFSLRSRRSFRVIRAALSSGGARFGMRVCEFSVQGNHVHLVAEAADAGSLSRGVQGLSVRLAKGMNRMMGRAGRVLADRYHARILRTPTEVARVLTYVRGNHDVHRRRWGQAHLTAADPYSSASADHGVVLPSPGTFLLAQARRSAERSRPPPAA